MNAGKGEGEKLTEKGKNAQNDVAADFHLRVGRKTSKTLEIGTGRFPRREEPDNSKKKKKKGENLNVDVQ